MKIRKIICGVTLSAVLFSSCFAADVEKYQKELDEIIRQQKETAANLTGVERELAEKMYEMLELDSKMMKYSTELGKLQTKVDDVSEKLSEQELALQNAAQQYNAAEDMYKARIKAIYENGIPSVIDILFSSKGISDFFSRMNVYTSILEYDRTLVSNMKNQKEYTDNIKKNIEVQKLQLEQLKYDTEKSTQALQEIVDAKNLKINELNSSKQNLEQKAKILQQQKDEANKRVEQELEKAYQESLQNGGTGFVGQFAWPVVGYNIITTRFNVTYDPFDSGKNYIHHGCDIAGSAISGKPILAVESGKVTVPAFSKGGYGNYVIIAHGKSTTDGNVYTSLYGHMSSIAVTTGQYVKKGQVIGYVGSTGWSTGPHLHLEMTRNGKKFDPLSLFTGMKFIYT